MIDMNIIIACEFIIVFRLGYWANSFLVLKIFVILTISQILLKNSLIYKA